MMLFGYVGALAIHVEDGEAKLVAYNAQSVVVDILLSSFRRTCGNTQSC